VKVIKILMLLVDVGKDGSGMGNGENLIGQALVPYYRQILPVINIFVSGTGMLSKLLFDISCFHALDAFDFYSPFFSKKAWVTISIMDSRRTQIFLSYACNVLKNLNQQEAVMLSSISNTWYRPTKAFRVPCN
jgi:hypothetical protein